MSDIREIIKGIEKLRPIPQVAHKIMSIAQDHETASSELSDVVVYDQALTAGLLRMCNCAYFGLSKKIDSVHHAVVYLGMDQVVDLVLMISGAENLKKRQDGYDLREGELWRNSVSSALIARELAEKKGSKNNHLIFTAALLKDIGKVVLNQYVAGSSEKINTLVSRQGLSFIEAEKEVIGIDHAELGAMVAEEWNFAPKMVKVIRNHHLSEGLSNIDFETSIVFLADTLCMMMGIGVGGDGLAYRFHSEVLEHLNITERDMQEIMAGFAGKIKQVEDFINLS